MTREEIARLKHDLKSAQDYAKERQARVCELAQESLDDRQRANVLVAEVQALKQRAEMADREVSRTRLKLEELERELARAHRAVVASVIGR